MKYICNRCGGLFDPTCPNETVDGKVYHLFCAMKVKQEKENEQTTDVVPTGTVNGGERP